MSSPEKIDKAIECIDKAEAEIDKAIECIDKAEAVFYKRFPTFMGSLAGSPLFAEIVRYFLEEEAETKQLLKD